MCGGVEVSVEDIVYTVASELPDGVTISGGEPFLQAEDLAKLVKELKDLGFPIMVYTGYRYETLLELARGNESIKVALENIDVLIDGEYIQEEDHNEKWRGSANQRFIMLSSYYDVSDFEGYGRDVEFRIVEDVLSMIGVPSKAAKEVMDNMKETDYESEI